MNLKRPVIFLLFPTFLSILTQAQHKMSQFEGEPLGKATKIEVDARFVGVVNPSIDADGKKWMVDVSRLTSYDHGSPSTLDSLKSGLLKEKLAHEAEKIEQGSGASRAIQPEVGTQFGTHNVINSTPPDNTMAISDGGMIVTSDNTTIEMYSSTGSPLISTLTTHEEWFDDVAGSVNIDASLFDPRVIYDPVEDRFIFVILHGSSSSSSKIFVCFSQTNNPAGNWNVYELDGDPFNNNLWFDFPNIGISENDLFITGNLFTNNDNFQYSIVYQMDKSGAYNGSNNVATLSYNNIPGGSIGSFTLVPASYGQDGEYGPGIYLVNANSGNGTRINLYEIDDAATANPSLSLLYSPIVQLYQAPADAVQPNSNELVRTNDSRMQHAFYLDGMIHAVHQTNYQSGYSGLTYYRIPIANPSQTVSSKFGEVGTDFSFPSLASFALEENERSVMIGFLAVSSSIFPQMRVVNCDHIMTWGEDVVVRTGQSHIDTWVDPPKNERWGDYSDMQRKHNATGTPVVWIAGCYAASNNRWKSWCAEISGEYEVLPSPEADFGSDTIAGYAPVLINFSDSSINNPTAWNWSFEGGSPVVSSNQHPNIVYQDTGWFDVELRVSNAVGTDSILKEAYIHILSSDTARPEGENELGQKAFDLQVFPNPVVDYELVTIKIDNPIRSDMKIDIVDMQGRVIRKIYDNNMRAGMHQLTFNKLALAPGNYIVQINRNGKLVQSEKVIVQ